MDIASRADERENTKTEEKGRFSSVERAMGLRKRVAANME